MPTFVLDTDNAASFVPYRRHGSRHVAMGTTFR
jgi:hypothetical protein